MKKCGRKYTEKTRLPERDYRSETTDVFKRYGHMSGATFQVGHF